MYLICPIRKPRKLKAHLNELKKKQKIEMSVENEQRIKMTISGVPITAHWLTN